MMEKPKERIVKLEKIVELLRQDVYDMWHSKVAKFWRCDRCGHVSDMGFNCRECGKTFKNKEENN